METKVKTVEYNEQKTEKPDSGSSPDKSSGKSSSKNGPQTKKILSFGAVISAVLLVLLGGLSLVLLSLKNIHLVVELKKDSQNKL